MVKFNNLTGNLSVFKQLPTAGDIHTLNQTQILAHSIFLVRKYLK